MSDSQKTTPAPPEGDQLSGEALRGATLSGVRWVAISRGIYEISAFAANIALTRLIAPAEFGLAAVALVVPMLATILTFEGFGSALVQREETTLAHERASVTLSLFTGAVLTALLALFSTTAAPGIFGAREAGLLLAISPVFALAGLSTVPRARLQRQLTFRRLAMNDVLVFNTGIAVSIPMAILGYGASALIVGALVGQLAGSLALVAAAGLPLPGWHKREMGEIWRYGLPASAAGVVFSGRRALPWIILGATMAPALVGQFHRAWQLGAEYQSKVTAVMLGVVFPIFSRASTLGEKQVLRGRVVRLNAMIVLPAMGLLAVTAPEVVGIMYGSAWAPSAQATQVLALAGMALALMSGTEALTLALGHPKALLAFHTTFLLVLLAGLLVAAPSDDLVTLSVAIVVVHVIMLIVAQKFLIGRYAKIPFSELWRDAGPAFISTAIASGAGWLAAGAARDAGWPSFFVFAIVAIIGAVVYAAALRLLFRRAWSELARLPRLLIKR